MFTSSSNHDTLGIEQSVGKGMKEYEELDRIIFAFYVCYAEMLKHTNLKIVSNPETRVMSYDFDLDENVGFRPDGTVTRLRIQVRNVPDRNETALFLSDFFKDPKYDFSDPFFIAFSRSLMKKLFVEGKYFLNNIVTVTDNSFSVRKDIAEEILFTRPRNKPEDFISFQVRLIEFLDVITSNEIMESFWETYEIINWGTHPGISSWYFLHEEDISGMLRIMHIDRISFGSDSYSRDYTRVFYAEDDQRRPYVFFDSSDIYDFSVGEEFFASFSLLQRKVIAGRLGRKIKNVRKA